MAGKGWQETKDALFSINEMANMPGGNSVVNNEEEGGKEQGLPLRWEGGNEREIGNLMENRMALYAGFEKMTARRYN